MRRAIAFAFLAGVCSCGGTVDSVFGPTTGAGGEGGSVVSSASVANGGAGATGSATGTGASGGGSGGCVVQADCAYLADACHVGNCINGACTQAPANDGGPCDDGLFCTEGDLCSGGLCYGSAAKVCPGNGACQIGACNEAAHACAFVAGNDGASCDDGNPCTLSGTCSAGACAPGPPIDCSALNSVCHIGVCDTNVGCVAVPANDGAGCDDGLFCTVQDACYQGTCSGAPKPCPQPANVCFVAACNEATDSCAQMPGNDGTFCNDGSPCTAGEKCSGGACTGGQPANDGMACDDGNACTSGDHCAAGSCTGSSSATVYFTEDFSDNGQGWTLGPEWQIGPAQASMGGAYGADPDSDHSPSADDGVAGVDIGGNANTMLHPFYYLESPAFDTAVAPGSVFFTFYRWLNSDYDPYMHNVVEVWTGSQWVVVWESGGQAIQDSPPAGAGWTFKSYDVSAYKNAAMRVRFGFSIGSQGVFTIGSWNIDDVVVASAACP